MSLPLEGHGVANYSTDKSSYGFTPTTTDFDDALLKRGIVTFEQCMIAKGASPEEARRLRLLQEENKKPIDHATLDQIDDERRHELQDEDSSSDSDDEFLREYRTKRISEMKKQHEHAYGEVVYITRPEWTAHVNESSKVGNRWVVVHLSFPHGEEIDMAIANLAKKHPNTKFVSIEYNKAVPNWPESNLPAFFIYRDGELMHKIVGMKNNDQDSIEWRLGKYGVVEADVVKPHVDDIERDYGRYKGNSGSHFGGMMSSLATTRDSDEEDDLDD